MSRTDLSGALSLKWSTKSVNKMKHFMFVLEFCNTATENFESLKNDTPTNDLELHHIK